MSLVRHLFRHESQIRKYGASRNHSGQKIQRTCWTKSLLIKLWRKIFRFICIARRRPIRVLRPKAAIAGMCFRPCRISKAKPIGKRKPNLTSDKIYEYLEKHYMPDLSKHIITETHIDPLHFENTLNSYLGNAFGVEPTLDAVGLSAPAQPQRRHRKSLFCRRGNASRRGTSGRDEFGKNRCGND